MCRANALNFYLYGRLTYVWESEFRKKFWETFSRSTKIEIILENIIIQEAIIGFWRFVCDNCTKLFIQLDEIIVKNVLCFDECLRLGMSTLLIVFFMLTTKQMPSCLTKGSGQNRARFRCLIFFIRHCGITKNSLLYMQHIFIVLQFPGYPIYMLQVSWIWTSNLHITSNRL